MNLPFISLPKPGFSSRFPPARAILFSIYDDIFIYIFYYTPSFSNFQNQILPILNFISKDALSFISRIFVPDFRIHNLTVLPPGYIILQHSERSSQIQVQNHFVSFGQMPEKALFSRDILLHFVILFVIK